MMTQSKWKAYDELFKKARLSKVSERGLPIGQFTDQQISELVGVEELRMLLADLPTGGTPEERRAALCLQITICGYVR